MKTTFPQRRACCSHPDVRVHIWNFNPVSLGVRRLMIIMILSLGRAGISQPVLTLPPDVTVDCSFFTDPADLGEAMATGGCLPWINEFHYDNASTDVNEFIEIAGPAGTDLSGWSIVRYSEGAVYSSPAGPTVSGVIDDEGNGFGTLVFLYPVNGLQNGVSDGFALVDPDGLAIEFLSYEGTMIAFGGPADGMTSVDVGIVESGVEPIGNAILRIGTGNTGSDFTWTESTDDSPGFLNSGQTMDPAPPEIVISYSDDETPCQFITRTWTATDDCGNQDSGDQIITLEDLLPPDLMCPADVTLVSYDDSTDPAFTGYALATDNCNDPFITVLLELPQMNCPAADVLSRTWIAVDACNNQEMCVQTITIPQQDTDEDGVGDHCDNSPFDYNPLQEDGDGDGNGDVSDNCAEIANPGQEDADGDEAGDACDQCPDDPTKVDPGDCGCGESEDDTDGDSAADCIDGCPMDPDKVSPGICGCGFVDNDTDGDGTVDCNDGCPMDPNKIIPGICGCGVADDDADSDGFYDCVDNCPALSNPGQEDGDMDGIGNACDPCPDTYGDACGSCDDGILNGDEEGIDCGGTDCDPCTPPDAVCGVFTVFVDPFNPDFDGPGIHNIWLIPSASLDGGSTSSSLSPDIDVKRYLSNLTFDWTTNGACIDIIPNGGGLNNADKGLVYRDCLPVRNMDFNVYRLYKLRITDEFGSDDCAGTVKVISEPMLTAPVIHLVIPDTDEYISIDRNSGLGVAEEHVASEIADLIVVPNPGQDAMQVNWSAFTEGDAMISVMDMSGRRVISQALDVFPGENKVVFDMTAVPSGVYAIMVRTDRSVMSVKWIKD